MGQARKGMSVKGDRTETSTWNMGGGGACLGVLGGVLN